MEAQDGGKGTGSVGGKAKQVEKRRKQEEEEWGAENRDMETKARAA